MNLFFHLEYKNNQLIRSNDPNNIINSIKTTKSNIISIILQPSPVATHEQLNRLKNIDISWAKTLEKINLYASMYNNSELSFVNIQSINLYSDLTIPFSTLVNSLFEVIVKSPSVEWIVYGNDHSFFIPQNLYCFLSTLDSSLPMYTGNRLKLEYLGSTLYFASGGAGSVLSHVSVKLFLIVLLINKNIYFDIILNEYHSNNFINYKITINNSNLDFRPKSDVLCSFMKLSKWLKNDISNLKNMNPQVTID